MEFNSINETFNNVMKTEDLSEDEINELEIELRNIENENSKSSNLNNSNNNNNNLIKETDSFLNNDIISIQNLPIPPSSFINKTSESIDFNTESKLIPS